VALVGLWWVVTALGLVDPVFLPPPNQVAQAIADNLFASTYIENYNLGSGGIAGSMVYTITNIVIALVISCVAGTVLGLVSARLDLVRAVLDPIMLTVGTLPVLVTAPFFLIWFATDRSAQVLLLLVYQVTIIYLFTQRAVGNLDPIYESAARTLGASRGKILRDVYLVGTLPEMLGGIRIALAGAWGLEAIAELLGAPEGIGRIIQALGGASDVPTIMATILVLAIVAVGVDAIVAGVFGYITRWRAPERV
jgi:ABC-type nitrate/sulfonate/bicarbonate transport system permease component